MIAKRQYNIWSKVTAHGYKGDKSYGAKDTTEAKILVGPTPQTSELLVHHVTTRREEGEYTVFRFGVDLEGNGQLEVLKTKWMHTESKAWFDVDPTAPTPDALAERARVAL